MDVVENSGAAPVASFALSATNGYQYFGPVFTNTSSGYYTNQTWAWGDGSTNSYPMELVNPTHIYTNAGSYTVSLTVVGTSGGQSSVSSQNVVTVNPVVVDFSAIPVCESNGMSVIFTNLSHSSNSSLTNRHWFFGDGFNTNWPGLTDGGGYMYNYANPGVYTVWLQRCGTQIGCVSNSHVIVVSNTTVNCLMATTIFSNSPTSGTAPLHMHFYDQSTNLSFGVIRSNYWDFGDGGSTNFLIPTDVSHTYSNVGVYFATNIEFGCCNASTTIWTITASPSCVPPTNNFIAVPTLGPAPLSVTFTDLTTGTVASNYTDFGDGGWTNNFLPATNFVHQYTASGTYLVTNIEWGCGSACTSFVTITVSPSCTPPVASFTANKTNGPPNLQVIFTDTSIGTIANVTWTFGDGNSTNFTAPTPTTVTNTYTTGGHYSVTQIVDSASCGISTNGQPNLIWVYTPWEIWQNKYFGCIGCPQAAGNVDADGDGISNTNEFLAGTDPTNSMSALRITSVVRQAGTNIVITWTAVGGNSYVVQTNAPPASGSYTNNFADLSGTINVPGSGGDTTAVYTNWAGATNIPSLYYRIRLGP